MQVCNSEMSGRNLAVLITLKFGNCSPERDQDNRAFFHYVLGSPMYANESAQRPSGQYQRVSKTNGHDECYH